MITVPEESIWEGIADLLTDERIVAEGASAASIAAVQSMDDIAGENVVVPIIGRNLSTEKLRNPHSPA